MKKTLLVTMDYPPRLGGVAAYCKRVADSFSPEELVVLTDQYSGAGDKVMYRQLLFRRLWPKWLRGIFVIKKAARASRAEQILAAQLLPVGTMAWLSGLPYYVQVYGMDILQAKRSSRKAWLAKTVLKNARGVIANSQAVAKLVADFCPEQQAVEVIYPLPTPLKPASKKTVETIRKRYELTDRPVILTIGRLVSRKGQDKVLAAMLHIWQKYPRAVYVIAGDGPDAGRLRKMAAPHAEKVIFTGRLDEQEKRAWLEIADIFTMVSREMPGDIEGFGMVYLEANQVGLPVVAGASGGVPEAVLHEKTGLLVPPDNTDAIAGALLRLLDHPQEARRLGSRGKERLTGELNWEHELSKLKSFLH